MHLKNHLKYYFNIKVCLSFLPSVHSFVHVSEHQLQFLQENHKMSLIKVVTFVSGVTKMHLGLSHDPCGPGRSQTQNVSVQQILSSILESDLATRFDYNFFDFYPTVLLLFSESHGLKLQFNQLVLGDWYCSWQGRDKISQTSNFILITFSYLLNKNE